MNVICRALGGWIMLAILVTALRVDAQTAPYPSRPVASVPVVLVAASGFPATTATELF